MTERTPSSRYVCVHGHFYQPPRENPWLETVQIQDSAYPYHDWNERITAECYAQNAASRVLDDDGRIVHIVNNYAGISFNIGPTLLAWMDDAAPEVHEAIVAADRESRGRFGGHGSAMAQAYGHIIMPLANARDRRTQVRWGVADFVHRFGREPEGMWLPETAVDTDSLEAMAAEGIAFTVLEPHQAQRVRSLDGGRWRSADAIDTTMPYLVKLPSGNTISVFFYDGPISRAIAFEGLLADGSAFARRLLTAPVPDRDGAKLVHVATDGESYGHHHRHGDMALAFALHELEAAEDALLTNYGEFLELHPPTHQVEIAEDTSWSCAHGIERWRSDCGCADGQLAGATQEWRAPLRDALDWLRDEVEPRFEDRSRGLLPDPWEARDAYIDLVLDRSDEARRRFLAAHAAEGLNEWDERVALRLMELQRNAMLMYTSCGWFFDDLARIEAVQVLRYAGRVLELAGDVLGVDLEDAFLDRLAKARSNDPDEGDGRAIYDRHVRPTIVTLDDVAGHYAVSSAFARYGRRDRVHCYRTESLAHHEATAGPARLATGRVRIRSILTGDETTAEYGVLHLGDHNVEAGVRARSDGDGPDAVRQELEASFHVADFPETLRRIDERFGARRYTLRSLFVDEQREVLRTILDASIEEARVGFRNIYRPRAPLMRYLTEIGARLPRSFRRAAEVAINDELRRAFADENVTRERVQALMDDATTWELDLDTEGLARILSQTVQDLTATAASELPEPSLFDHFGEAELAFFTRAITVVELARMLPFEVDLWRAQNVFYDAVHRLYPDLTERAAAGDATAQAWVDSFRRLGDALMVVVDVQPHRGRR